ncbi:MAG: mercuric reductase [Hyphomonadaceae bacterium]|nr:MAG: mercuric reductase [Hyphomonadaceae bacterium]
MKKLITIAIIAIAIFAFFASGLQHQLSFENLKSSLGSLIAAKDASPFLFIGGFMIIYIISAAFSLPIVVPLSLGAGAIFGVIEGTIIVSFASTIGATCSFLVSRFLLRDSLEAKFGARLAAINEGMKRDGAFYLFSLRLIPLFPFWLINLLMGLTKLKTWTFYWVSQVGMLLGTIVYVNAGTQLAQLDSMAGILSPNLIISFAILGMFPWFAKVLMAQLRKARTYRGFHKPKQFDRDIVVIGAGAAGLVSSLIGAAVKAKVTLVEGHKMGGDCLNYGCVPSKALIKSAKVAHLIANANDYGLGKPEAKVDFKAVMARVHNIISQIEPHDSVERYQGLGVDVQTGHARIVDPWHVEITLENGAKKALTTRNIIVATGAKPFVPPLQNIEKVGYLTSDSMWAELAKLDKIPPRMVVLGGGPIGCELAQALARLGSEVTLIEMAARLIIREDEEVSAFAKTALENSGVNVLLAHKALGFEKTGKKKSIILDHQGAQSKIEFDQLICAVGRVARLEGFGLEELGIAGTKSIEVNEFLETKYPNILAAGDVVGPFQFTHVASHQAWYASVNALFGMFKKFKTDYRVIPWTTFIDPEIARLGLNEQDAIAQNIAYEVTRYDIDDLDRAICDGSAHGFVKVLTVPQKDKILGVTIIGEHAAEIMAEFVLAMKWGLGLNKILGTIHTYPTFAEANKYAAGAWKRKNVAPWTLALLEKFHAFRRGQK